MSPWVKSGLAVVLTIGAFVSADSAPAIEDPFRVIAQMDRLAEKTLWPGFDPRDYPVAIYDGSRTWLFRHPHPPPDEFTPGVRDDSVWVHRGRHPAMRSNSKATIGDVTTGTLLLTFRPGRSAREEASILIHETFHIFQDANHPQWTANEAHRFTYPVTDARNYLEAILEDHALARALNAEDIETTAEWTATAMELRTRRQSRLAPEHREFELGLEMMEGTAFYVAHLALGESESTERLLDTLPPEKFRWRPYATGGAIAALLDRLTPGWKTRIEQSVDLTLDQLLREYLSANKTPPTLFPEADLQRFRQLADTATTDLIAEREAQRSAFEDPQSWRVILEVAPRDMRFDLESFDPINMRNLGNGDVLHGSRLTLAHPTGKVTMVNPRFVRREIVGLNALSSVTEGHPLFGACRKVAFVGFADEPQALATGDRVTLHADGFDVDLDPATFIKTGKTIHVTVGGRPRNGEARIRYLGHAGWLVQTSEHTLVFDYTGATEGGTLDDGILTPEALAGRNLLLFVSHAHGDHFRREVLDLRDTVEELTVVMGWDEPDSGVVTVPPDGEWIDVSGAKVFALHHSFDDIPEGFFLVRSGGLTIYHSGDHGTWSDPPNERFRANIDRLAAATEKIDIAFISSFGARGTRQGLNAGDVYSIETLKPKVTFPMHCGDCEDRYRNFADEAAALHLPTRVGVADARGASFLFRNGTLVENSQGISNSSR